MAETGFVKRYLVFAAMTFVGMIIGAWVLEILNLQTLGPAKTVVAFMVPVFFVFYLWDKWGEKAARQI